MEPKGLDLVREEGNYLLPDDLIEDLINFYFTNLPVWMPILHREAFQPQTGDPKQLPNVTIILHAIVSLWVPFSDDPRLRDPEVRSRCSR
jgi:hypothetical protein